MQELLNNPTHRVPFPVQMRIPDEIVDAHKDSAATLGDREQVSPFGEDEEGLSAAGDENQENHNGRVQLVHLRKSSLTDRACREIDSGPGTEGHHETTLQGKLECLLSVGYRIHVTRTKHYHFSKGLGILQGLERVMEGFKGMTLRTSRLVIHGNVMLEWCFNAWVCVCD